MKTKESVIKKTLLLSLLVLITESSWAVNWQKVYDRDGSTVYIDSMTIREDDRLPIVWMITNFSSRSPRRALSQLGHTEFDCKEERSRSLTSIGYPDSMAKGEATSSDIYASTQSLGLVSKWHPVKLGNMIEPVFKIVCAKP